MGEIDGEFNVRAVIQQLPNFKGIYKLFDPYRQKQILAGVKESNDLKLKLPISKSALMTVKVKVEKPQSAELKPLITIIDVVEQGWANKE